MTEDFLDEKRMRALGDALALQSEIDYKEAGPKATHGSIAYRGVLLDSRWNVLREYETMRRVVDGLPDLIRHRISSLRCDSKAGSTFTIEIKPGLSAPEIPSAIEAAILEANGGHNGIYENSESGFRAILHPHWLGDDEEFSDEPNSASTNSDDVDFE